MTRLFRRLRALLTRGTIASELDDEMRLHLELRQQRLERDGLAADEAYTAARRRFGNRAVLAEASVDAWGWRWLHDVGQDVRYALRGFARHKSFTATAIGSLAIGIGANTALFSVVNALVLRPLPFPEPERLVRIYGTSQLTPQRDNVFNLAEVRRQAASFEAIAGCEPGARYLRRSDRSDRVMTVTAERDFFAVLQAAPLFGRTFGYDDGTDVAVLGEAFWRREFDGDRGVIGTTMVLDDRRFTIVGVMPASFQFPYSAGSLLPGTSTQTRSDVWIPLEPALTARGRFSHVTARLRPGVTIAAARAELSAIAATLPPPPPSAGPRRGYAVVPLAEDVAGTAVTRPLFLLFGAVGLVLALACANVANLLLVRMTLRDREVSVRAGLGASPLRLVRQFLAESLLLSLSGGVAGLLLAWSAAKQLLRSVAAEIPRAHDIALDWRVFAFLFGLCTVVGILVGLAPGLIALRKDARNILHGADGRSTMTQAQRRTRDLLVIVEVALAFSLAVGASLLVRELLRLRGTDLGMETHNVVTVHLGRRMPPSGREGPAESVTRRFYEISNRVAALPSVRAAGFTQMLPLQSWGWFSNSSEFFEQGRPPVDPVFPIELRFVTPGYFRALGIEVQRGRGFTDDDRPGTPMVIVINDALARRQFGSADPIGRRMNRGTIVGVVRDVRNVNPDRQTLPEIYYAVAQNWSQVSELGMTLVASTTDRPDVIVDAVRSIVREVDPLLAVFEIKTMDRVVADSMMLFRLVLWVFTGFAALAVGLAMTGTYGVISYAAAARAREFALRMALGATPRRVAAAVLRHGLVLTGAGLACGIAAGFAAAPLLDSLPVAVRPPDLLIMAPVMMIVTVVSLAACVLPALRAARVDLMAVLRNE
jgi:putative ABC transport system permease protein